MCANGTAGRSTPTNCTGSLDHLNTLRSNTLKPINIPRRSFLATAALASIPRLQAQTAAPKSAPTRVLGQGDFRYRHIPEWGVLGKETPVKNCHGIAITREQNIILLTDHTSNNVLIYSPNGKLLNKWGTRFPGAHGLSLVTIKGRETLFITDLATHRVEQTSLDGETLAEWSWPQQSGKYAKDAEYKPSWTMHLPDASFIVMDGYGKDYFLHYGSDGLLQHTFGGSEGGIAHWGPHGGTAFTSATGATHLVVAMSDQQHLLHLEIDGKERARTPLPGGNPRQIRPFGEHFVCAHLADNWPKDRNSRGFISILDRDFRVISNIGGTAPEYDGKGHLTAMRSTDDVFTHPHDAVIAPDGALYVAQFASGNTYPLKFERI